MQFEQKDARDTSMKNPPHPGLSVRHDCLEPLGLTVTEAARRLGGQPKAAFRTGQRPFGHLS